MTTEILKAKTIKRIMKKALADVSDKYNTDVQISETAAQELAHALEEFASNVTVRALNYSERRILGRHIQQVFKERLDRNFIDKILPLATENF